jgi:hypothetical protein
MPIHLCSIHLAPGACAGQNDAMIARPFSRRQLLLASAAALGGVASAGGAAAFSIETLPEKSPLALELASRCGGDTAHLALAAELQAKLDAETAPVGTTLTESAPCPFCGCPVTVSRKVE